MRHARTVAFVAGVAFITLALIVQGLLPALIPESRRTTVSRALRTELGEIKWALAEARPPSALEARGRNVYIREGCWYCHSQYVRPVAGEPERWGPVSQAGEFAFDQPHLLSTRRIGPDLSRVGLKYSDGWHHAHFWEPRAVVPDSIMPRFPWLYDGPHGPFEIVVDGQGRRTLERGPATEALFDFGNHESIELTPSADGLVWLPRRNRYPVIVTPNGEFDGDHVRVLAPTDDLESLVAYLQGRGQDRGKWRDVFAPQQLQAATMGAGAGRASLDRGRSVYTRRCVGCHGEAGDGNGPAATFLEVRPRIFTSGTFKYRLTPVGSLPTDGDLLRTITRGVRGTAMPTWHMLRDDDRLAVIRYLKTVLAVDPGGPGPEDDYAFFLEEEPEPALHVGTPPRPTPALLARGETVWKQALCGQCHGEAGRGDGPSAVGLRDEWGFASPPADLTAGRLRSGPSVQDIYRTLATGLAGTPMPAYGDVLPERDLWALAYHVLSLSAYRDSLTGVPLELTIALRTLLDDPSSPAGGPESPLRAGSDPIAGVGSFPGLDWALRRGVDAGPTPGRSGESDRDQPPRNR